MPDRIASGWSDNYTVKSGANRGQVRQGDALHYYDHSDTSVCRARQWPGDVLGGVAVDQPANGLCEDCRQWFVDNRPY